MSERGYASVLVLALLLAGTLLVGVAVDVARLVVAWREASFIAHSAAEAGAGWVEPDAMYDGRLVIDVDAATDAAESVIAMRSSVGVVEVSPTRVCVAVRASVAPGIIAALGAGPHEAVAEACAEPRRG